MDYSFYGGRRGISFILAGSFKNKEMMITAFKRGTEYTDINFDEYVIIDTEDKNDSTNGQVYRRGYNYTNQDGGAIYVGQIVGPSGLSPHLELSTINQVEKRINALTPEQLNNEQSRFGKGQYTLTNSLVPGYTKDPETQEEHFNDSIAWAFCSLRDANGKETVASIGFSIPYLVIDYKAQSVDAYYKKELLTRIDTYEHPFYQKWNLSIPKGVKGDAVLNLRVITANIHDNVLTDKYYSIEQQQDDRNNARRIIVYDLYNYDVTGDPIPETHYLGDFNIITKIEQLDMQHDEMIRISYGHENAQDLALNHIVQMVIEPQNYHLLVLYSDPEKRGSVVYNGREDWTDLGCVRDYNGILTGVNYTLTDLDLTTNNITQIINKLNIKHPTGLIGNNLQGKLITVGEPNSNKMFFGFNYTTDAYGTFTKKWYYLGSFGNVPGVVIGAADDPNTQALAESLPAGSIWFIVK